MAMYNVRNLTVWGHTDLKMLFKVNGFEANAFKKRLITKSLYDTPNWHEKLQKWVSKP